ncbi:hypothetical protein SH139x_004204 [Planctomycetaceae bacterium SH139]
MLSRSGVDAVIQTFLIFPSSYRFDLFTCRYPDSDSPVCVRGLGIQIDGIIELKGYVGIFDRPLLTINNDDFGQPSLFQR